MAIVIAHRTCPLHEAENSIAGIERAGLLGADAVEVDVRVTRDGVAVLVHDRTLLRIAGWPLPTRWLSFDRVRRLRRRDNGLQIPTFEEVLVASLALPGDVRMAIDLKDPNAGPPVAELIRKHHAQDRVLLWAQSMDAVRHFAREFPDVERALLRDTRAGKATRRFLDDAERCEAHAISAHWNRISSEFVAEAHARGLKVYAMAQNSETQAEKLATGLDGVVTNWPEAALTGVRGGRE